MLLPRSEMAVEYWMRAGCPPTLSDKLPAVHEAFEGSTGMAGGGAGGGAAAAGKAAWGGWR
jgi:hypothetical protein